MEYYLLHNTIFSCSFVVQDIKLCPIRKPGYCDRGIAQRRALYVSSMFLKSSSHRRMCPGLSFVAWRYSFAVSSQTPGLPPPAEVKHLQAKDFVPRMAPSQTGAGRKQKRNLSPAGVRESSRAEGGGKCCCGKNGGRSEKTGSSLLAQMDGEVAPCEGRARKSKFL